MEQNPEEVLRLLRIKQVQGRIGLGRSTIYELMNPRSARHDPSFPTPIRVSTAAVAWDERELNAWIKSRKDATTRLDMRTKLRESKETKVRSF